MAVMSCKRSCHMNFTKREINIACVWTVKGAQRWLPNSAQFLGVIKNITVSPYECMTSFDLVSLSTGILFDLALETIRKLFTRIPLSVATVSMMHLLNQSPINYFQFNGKFYWRVKSMPMDSPISGLIVEAVLERFEVMVLQAFTP